MGAPATPPTTAPATGPATGPDTAHAPEAALWHALGQAAERRELGLTVLLALLSLGDSGAEAAHPLTVINAIAALQSVGLGREARGLALEAVSGAGP